jgi:chaperonin cofactor prefoldin
MSKDIAIEILTDSLKQTHVLLSNLHKQLNDNNEAINKIKDINNINNNKEKNVYVDISGMFIRMKKEDALIVLYDDHERINNNIQQNKLKIQEIIDKLDNIKGNLNNILFIN